MRMNACAEVGRCKAGARVLRVAFFACLAFGLFIALNSSPAFAQAPAQLVRDIAQVSDPFNYSYPAYLTPVGRFFFYSARSQAHGLELWKSDGTASGTLLV